MAPCVAQKMKLGVSIHPCGVLMIAQWARSPFFWAVIVYEKLSDIIRQRSALSNKIYSKASQNYRNPSWQRQSFYGMMIYAIGFYARRDCEPRQDRKVAAVVNLFCAVECLIAFLLCACTNIFKVYLQQIPGVKVNYWGNFLKKSSRKAVICLLAADMFCSLTRQENTNVSKIFLFLSKSITFIKLKFE